MKVSHDTQSLSVFKRDTSKFLKQMKKTGQPIILTIKGKEVAVVHDPDSYQEYVRDKERLEVIAGVLRGIEDVKAGRVRAAEEVFDDIEKRFGMGK